MTTPNSNWKMPRPQIGDVVLFSADAQNFSNPALGWVVAPPGDRTICCLVFGRGGFVEQRGVHHKDDPQLQEDNGWAGMGVWELAPATAAVYKALDLAEKTSPQEKMNSGRHPSK